MSTISEKNKKAIFDIDSLAFYIDSLVGDCDRCTAFSEKYDLTILNDVFSEEDLENLPEDMFTEDEWSDLFDFMEKCLDAKGEW